MSLFENYVDLHRKQDKYKKLLKTKNKIEAYKDNNVFLRKVIPFFTAFFLSVLYLTFNITEMLSSIFNIPYDSSKAIINNFVGVLIELDKVNNFYSLSFFLLFHFILFLSFFLFVHLLNYKKDHKNIFHFFSYIFNKDDVNIIIFLFFVVFAILISINYMFFVITFVLSMIGAIAFLTLSFFKLDYQKEYIKDIDNEKFKNMNVDKVQKQLDIDKKTISDLKNQIIKNANEMSTVAIESTKLKDENDSNNLKINLAKDIVDQFEKVNEAEVRLEEINKKIKKVFNKKTQVVNE